MDTKEINLCDLLADHVGEVLYSPIYGNTQLCEIGDDTFPLITEEANFMADGKLENFQYGQCMLFPSRALYEQYPLDPYSAWMKWWEEQKKYTLAIVWNCPDREHSESIKYIDFRTTADRGKCIEEIKAIIEKYSK